ncbi:urea transporter [Staphylococcus lutrae]|uniref:Urea transporter n=1 Tax=Staphylococcus lutrae TaxID=155085 RepID=A0AAC9RTX1_9STAP|nr:urea transporter [Staphylococcus lutrae]ARJ50635.1 urea transporter [Staphylococcus lutrae]PNZ38822.1 urea transporter [Staphylococcus lutrae]
MSKWIHPFFKNISQVVLLENSLTGLLILIALWIGNWKIGLAAMIGSLISLLTAHFFNYTEEEIQSGLAGFNPVLIAIDLTLFLFWSWQSLLVIIVSIILAMPIAQALKSFLKPFRLAELTTPFVLITWVVLLMSEQFKFIKTNVNLLPLTADVHVNLNTAFHPFHAFFSNVSQIFLIEHTLSGILIVIACWIASKRAGIYILLANLLGLVLEFFFGADITTLNEGLFGFNLMLSVIAVGVTFRASNHLHPVLAFFLTVVMTPMMYAATVTFLEPIGIPALTFPFILTTWTLLLAGQAHTRSSH